MELMLNIDSVEYQHKPTDADEIRRIQSRMKRPVTITFDEFAKAVCHGRSFRQSAASGASTKDFISACILALDIDNKKDYLTVEEAQKIAEESDLQINFMYLSFSSTPEHRRFRMVFVLDEPVTDVKDFHALYDYMISLYPTCDTSCRNPAHFFFGTQAAPIIEDASRLNSTADLLRRAAKLQQGKEPQKIKPRAAKKPDTVNDQTMSRNIQAIRDHDAKYLKRKLHRQKTIFDNRGEFWDWLYREDIAELLDIDTPKSFRCIFHDDTNNSASIFQSKGGTWLYKCFCPDCIATKLNIKQLVELLGDFKSEYRSIEFIKEIYAVSIKETAWSREQLENIERISDCFNRRSEHGFDEICPTACKNTRYTADVYNAILRIAKRTIYPERDAGEKNVIFYASVRQIAEEAGKTSLDKVSKHVKLLLYHQMLEIVPDDKVPRGLLAKVLKNRTQQTNHTQFYQIPSWVLQQTQRIEEQGVSWREHGYRLNAISYEGFYRSEGVEVATALYPQTSRYTDRNGEQQAKTPTKRSDRRSDDIATCILNQIQSRGYATERDTVEILGHYIDGIPTETQIKRSVLEIMDSYGLQKIRANKQIKAKFHMDLPPRAFPTIIVPCDEV